MIKIETVTYQTRKKLLGIPYGKLISKTEMTFILYNELSFFVKDTDWKTISKVKPEVITSITSLPVKEGLKWLQDNSTSLEEITLRIEQSKSINQFIQEEFKKEEL